MSKRRKLDNAASDETLARLELLQTASEYTDALEARTRSRTPKDRSDSSRQVAWSIQNVIACAATSAQHSSPDLQHVLVPCIRLLALPHPKDKTAAATRHTSPSVSPTDLFPPFADRYSTPTHVSFSPAGRALLAYFPPASSVVHTAFATGVLALWRRGKTGAGNDWNLSQTWRVCPPGVSRAANDLLGTAAAGQDREEDGQTLEEEATTPMIEGGILEIVWLGGGRKWTLSGSEDKGNAASGPFVRSAARGPQFVSTRGEVEQLSFVILGQGGETTLLFTKAGSSLDMLRSSFLAPYLLPSNATAATQANGDGTDEVGRLNELLQGRLKIGQFAVGLPSDEPILVVAFQLHDIPPPPLPSETNNAGPSPARGAPRDVLGGLGMFLDPVGTPRTNAGVAEAALLSSSALGQGSAESDASFLSSYGEPLGRFTSEQNRIALVEIRVKLAGAQTTMQIRTLQDLHLDTPAVPTANGLDTEDTSCTGLPVEQLYWLGIPKLKAGSEKERATPAAARLVASFRAIPASSDVHVLPNTVLRAWDLTLAAPALSDAFTSLECRKDPPVPSNDPTFAKPAQGNDWTVVPSVHSLMKESVVTGIMSCCGHGGALHATGLHSEGLLLVSVLQAGADEEDRQADAAPTRSTIVERILQLDQQTLRPVTAAHTIIPRAMLYRSRLAISPSGLLAAALNRQPEASTPLPSQRPHALGRRGVGLALTLLPIGAGYMSTAIAEPTEEGKEKQDVLLVHSLSRFLSLALLNGADSTDVVRALLPSRPAKDVSDARTTKLLGAVILEITSLLRLSATGEMRSKLPRQMLRLLQVQFNCVPFLHLQGGSDEGGSVVVKPKDKISLVDAAPLGSSVPQRNEAHVLFDLARGAAMLKGAQVPNDEVTKKVEGDREVNKASPITSFHPAMMYLLLAMLDYVQSLLHTSLRSALLLSHTFDLDSVNSSSEPLGPAAAARAAAALSPTLNLLAHAPVRKLFLHVLAGLQRFREWLEATGSESSLREAAIECVRADLARGSGDEQEVGDAESDAPRPAPVQAVTTELEMGRASLRSALEGAAVSLEAVRKVLERLDGEGEDSQDVSQQQQPWWTNVALTLPAATPHLEQQRLDREADSTALTPQVALGSLRLARALLDPANGCVPDSVRLFISPYGGLAQTQGPTGTPSTPRDALSKRPLGKDLAALAAARMGGGGGNVPNTTQMTGLLKMCLSCGEAARTAQAQRGDEQTCLCGGVWWIV